MTWQTSRVFKESLIAYNDSKVSVIINRGGTRSGKTFSVLQVLALIALHSPKPLVISVVTQTFPQLRQGAMRDFSKIIEGISYKENKSAHTFQIGNSLIEFFSADQYTKVLGAQRDILFINECNRLGYEVVRQLFVRTAGKKFLDYNPVSDFWINKEVMPRKDIAVINSTYKDNPFLSAEQVAEIESHKHNENWWRVYGLGLEGRLEGLVFSDFELVDDIPQGKQRVGIDFGFNDATAIVRVTIVGDTLYLDELAYLRGAISSDISVVMSNAGLTKRVDRIIGDSAAREQIETLYRDGWNIHSCVKGAGSVIGGIDKMKRYKIRVTKRSTNIINELYNYMWAKDKNDNLLNIPIDEFNHTIDAARYAVADLLENSGEYTLGYSRR